MFLVIFGCSTLLNTSEVLEFLELQYPLPEILLI